MKKYPIATALLTALLLASTAQAQQTVVKTKTKSAKRATADATAPLPPPSPGEAPDGPRPPRGPHGPEGRPGPGGPGGAGPAGRGPRGGRLQALTDVRGTLTAYLANNDEQVYNAFVLRPESGAADTIRFPRHLGQQLVAAAKPGSAITVTGFRETGPRGRNHFRFVSLTSGGQTVNDAPPARPATPPTPETTTAKGTIKELRRDPKGHIRGVVLSDQTVVQLPPTAVEQLSDKLTVGASLEAAGNLRTAHPGEARATTAAPARVVRAETLTLAGVKYLVR